MSQAIPLDHLVTLSEWERDWCHREERYEFVDGVPHMTPAEDVRNLVAASRLLIRLNRVLGDAWECAAGAGVLLRLEPRLTIRIPDLVVLRPGTDLGRNPVDPASILIAVEVLSPSTRRVDLGPKRREYARVGIPHYLVLDHYFGQPTLTLMTVPFNGDYTDEVSGEAVTLHLDGHSITVTVADLFPS